MKQCNNTNSLAKLRSKWFSKRTILTGLAALLAVGAQAQTPVFSNVWNVVAGTLTPNDLIITTGRNVRGMAISPITTNVVFVSTTAGTNYGNNHFRTLSFNGGTALAQGNATNVTGGSVSLGPVRFSDDGYIYTCNVSAGTNSTFRIYRWPSDTDFTTPSTVVYKSTDFFTNGPGSTSSFQWRIGDYMDVRGSGIKTEIVVVGNGAGVNITTNFVIFRPTDASATAFTNFSITIPGGVRLCGAGVTFEGTNNAIYVRDAGALPVYRVTYNPTNLTSTVASQFNMDNANNNGLKYYESTNGVKLIAAVCTSTAGVTNGIQHYAKVLQLTSPTTAAVVLNQPLPTPNQGNGDSQGLVDARNGYFVFSEPNNGVSLYKLDFINTAPPAVAAASSSSTIIQGFTNVFTASASGATPLSYQWYLVGSVATNSISNATNSLYTLAPAQTTNQGGYFVIVTNLYGKATSSVVNISVLPNGSSPLMTNLWSITGGSRAYVGGSATTTTRGLGYDPVLNRVVVVSRAGTNGVWLLDANTGAEVGTLDMSVFNNSPSRTGYGTFPINMCGVADDGVVYVANLCNAADEPFAIYSFASASDGVSYNSSPGAGYLDPAPGTLYSSVGGRLGDNMAVRGAGTNTQIICGSRNTGTNVVIFTTTDGTTFTPNIVAINTSNQEIGGLSVYWGAGNTFWAKTDSLNNIRQVSFDLTTLTATVIGSYPLLTSETIIGVDSDNGYVTVVGARENPQTLGVYDINNVSAALPIDREFFAGSTAGANIQSTGQSAVDVKGGRVFSLSTGTGILAVKYAGKLAISQIAGQQVVTWPTTNAVLQSASVVSGPYTDVSGASTPYTNSTGSVQFYRLRN